MAGELGDEERTTERSSVRADTMTETTIERGGASYMMPAPIDAGAEPAGQHPPLVIIEDATLGAAMGDELELGAAGGTHLARAGARDGDGDADDDDDDAPEREVDTADRKLSAPRPGDDFSAPTERLRPAPQLTRAETEAPGRAPTIDSGGVTDVLAVQLFEALEASAPTDEPAGERTRRRVTWLIDRATTASADGDHATAVVALDLALREEPESAVTQKLLHRHQPAILDVYQRYVGDIGTRPQLSLPMHQLAGERLETRAAFLLSRIDGTLTFEEILDVSGMQRLEAFRHLSLLLLRGILEVR